MRGGAPVWSVFARNGPADPKEINTADLAPAAKTEGICLSKFVQMSDSACLMAEPPNDRIKLSLWNSTGEKSRDASSSVIKRWHHLLSAEGRVHIIWEMVNDVLLGVHVVGGTVSMVIYGSAGSRKSKRWRVEGQCLKTKRIFRRMGHDCKSQVGVLINGITT
jgi:hypothetical protein